MLLSTFFGDTEIVSQTFFDTIVSFFDGIWDLFNSFTIPGINLTPATLLLGFMAFRAIILFTAKITNNAGMSAGEIAPYVQNMKQEAKEFKESFKKGYDSV